MKIQVLGSGCSTCKKLHELTIKAAKELNLATEIEYSDDIQKLLAMGVMSSPVLAIDGKPVSVGTVPSLEKIKNLICGEKDNEKEKPSQSGCSCGGNC